jgi:dTDP-4-amino-4,6-dideoxygalactose transaminase
VHYAGVACELDTVLSLARRYGITVVEDNAHALFGKYRGQYLGTFGVCATQSFHETKNFTCGEGGALVINDLDLVERAEIIREKGTNRSRFFRGQVDKYTWVDLGSSYLPSDVLAAMLWAQLQAREEIQTSRRLIWESYDANLKVWARENSVSTPFVPDYCEQAYHMYYVLMPSLDARQALIAHLRKRDILSVFHYVPLHNSPKGRSFSVTEANCPVTIDVSDRLVRLPFFTNMSADTQEEVLAAVHEFLV